MADVKSEQDWKAEEDARTLARASTIMRDRDRMKAARSAASRLLEDETERAKEQEEMTAALSKLAKRGRMGDYSKQFRETHERR
jgi:hypothetical protein